MKIMVLDNYDSFTYNLVHYLKEISEESVDVFRNDEIPVERVGEYDKIMISPGPGLPPDSGICLELIRAWAPKKSIFGVCLGCQAIAEVYGGSLINLPQVYHGVASNMKITDESEPIFRDIPTEFTAGRYHSWVINEEKFPKQLKVTARDEKDLIMAVSHINYDLRGVQFHPESVLTYHGKKMISNWLNI